MLLKRLVGSHAVSFRYVRKRIGLHSLYRAPHEAGACVREDRDPWLSVLSSGYQCGWRALKTAELAGHPPQRLTAGDGLGCPSNGLSVPVPRCWLGNLVCGSTTR